MLIAVLTGSVGLLGDAIHNLINPDQLEHGETIPLILTFRYAGAVTVEATVTPPGTP